MGNVFSQEYHFGKTKYFYHFHYYYRPPPQLTPSRRRPKPSKRLRFGPGAKIAPTYYLVGGFLTSAGCTNYLPPGYFLASAGRPGWPETNGSGCLGPGLGPGPPRGPKGPPMGAHANTHTPVSRFRPGRFQMAVSHDDLHGEGNVVSEAPD